MLAKRFLRENPQMQGKKHSKIGHLASIFNAADADFSQKYRRKHYDYTPLYVETDVP